MNENRASLVGEFLQNRIARHGTRGDAGTWQQTYATHLDYRDLVSRSKSIAKRTSMGTVKHVEALGTVRVASGPSR